MNKITQIEPFTCEWDKCVKEANRSARFKYSNGFGGHLYLCAFHAREFAALEKKGKGEKE